MFYTVIRRIILDKEGINRWSGHSYLSDIYPFSVGTLIMRALTHPVANVS